MLNGTNHGCENPISVNVKAVLKRLDDAALDHCIAGHRSAEPPAGRLLGHLDADRQHEPLSVLNEIVEVPQALDDCVIAGTAGTVLDRLIALTDQLGRFGTLVMAAHDWDDNDLWPASMQRLAGDIMSRLSQHTDQLPALD